MQRKKQYFIGIDVGGTKIAAGLITPQGKILLKKKIPVPLNARSAVLGRMIQGLIEEILDEKDVPVSSLYGIGLGIPGIVDPASGKILRTPNIKLAGYPLIQRLKKAFKTTIVLGNDVNLGVLGEKWLGAGKTADNLIGIFLGTGVGGGIVLDGKIYLGSQGAAGELGHMIIDCHSPHSSAGVSGTLEALTSRRAIERKIREAIRLKKKTIVTELTGGNLKMIKSRVLRKALKKRDPVVTRIINEVCFILGKTCISFRHIFNPDMIIFGGGVIEACGEYMLPRIKRISDKNPFLAGIDHCKIVSSQLGDDAVLLGAVALVKQNFKNDLI